MTGKQNKENNYFMSSKCCHNVVWFANNELQFSGPHNSINSILKLKRIVNSLNTGTPSKTRIEAQKLFSTC